MATPIKAGRKPINQPIVFFQSITALRAAEQRLAEADSTTADLPAHGYLSAFVCPGGDGWVDDTTHAFIGVDGLIYHSFQCAEVASLIEEGEL